MSWPRNNMIPGYCSLAGCNLCALLFVISGIDRLWYSAVARRHIKVESSHQPRPSVL